MYAVAQSLEATDTTGQTVTVSKHIFFPERGEDERPAKRICGTCPVKGFCLEYALAAGEKHGIWGGTSERQRRNLRRERRNPLAAGIQLQLVHIAPVIVLAGRRKRFRKQLVCSWVQLAFALAA
jgi:WhiB family transcriptional regulator, redox-sensing transcriptional regulator